MKTEQELKDKVERITKLQDQLERETTNFHCDLFDVIKELEARNKFLNEQHDFLLKNYTSISNELQKLKSSDNFQATLEGILNDPIKYFLSLNYENKQKLISIVVKSLIGV